MERIEYFVPGEPETGESILGSMRWPIAAGLAQAYVEAYTAPDDMVLVPYCQGPAVVQAIRAAGRRPVAVHYDPAIMLLVQAALDPPPRQELDAAVARLGDSLKQGLPLRTYLSNLYATTCPACMRPGIADYFVWDKEQGVPVAKYVRCPACTWDGRAAVDAEDQARLADVPAQGMHYHYVMDRVAPQPQTGPLQPRLEFLLELYSPRNLYALAELTLKIESLFPEGRTRRSLLALLLDCLDRGSSLAPLPESTARRRGLSRPGRYLERNIWRCFEEAVGRLEGLAGKPASDLVHEGDDFWQAPDSKAGFVGRGLVRDLRRRLPTRSVHLMLTSPPPLDSATWSLSYLWGAWLFEADAVAPLRPLLRQRTPDAAWYSEVMTSSLATLTDLLRDTGRLVFALSDARPAVVEALVLAAGVAQMGVDALIQGGDDYRLTLVPSSAQPVPVAEEPVELQIQSAAVAAATRAIQARGEPVPWRTLHAAILLRLAELGFLARIASDKGKIPSPLDFVAQQIEAALDDTTFVRLVDKDDGQVLWWLTRPSDLSPPLSDRVEAGAFQVLDDALALTGRDFETRLYALFPGVQTPEAALVKHCLESYGHQPTPGYWQLRDEDRGAARQAEGQSIIEHLCDLGRRLGYGSEPWRAFDVAWHRGSQVRAAFAVRWVAAVSEVLALDGKLDGAQPYLVIPGGRAALVSYKLAHNPLWQQTVDVSGWRFIKYRHVRQLVAQAEIDEYTLRTVTGLDPIVERESAQIPLF